VTAADDIGVSRATSHGLIARNTVSAFGARALLVLSVLALTPYLFRQLGPAGFGTWSVLFTFVSVAGIAENGLALAVVKLVAEERGRGGDPGRIVGAGVALMAALGLLAALLLALGAIALDGLAANSEKHAFTLGMLVLAGAVAVRAPLAAYVAVLKGCQRYDLANIEGAFLTVAFSVGAVVAIELDRGILGLAVAQAAALVAAGPLGLLLLARAEPGLRLRPRRNDGAAARKIVGFGSYTLLADSMGFIAARMDVVVIAAIRSAAAAAPFAAAVKLQSGIQSLVLPWWNLLLPMQAELWAAGRRREVAERLLLATRIATQITIPAVLALSLFATDLVRVWLGPEAPPITATIVILLLAVQIATLSAAPSESVLIAIGRVRAVGSLSLAEGLANITLSIVLVWRYGAIGAALGTLLTTAALAPIKLPLAARAVGLSLRRLLVGGVGTAVISTVPSAALMVALRLTLAPGAVRLMAGISLGVVAAAAVAMHQLGPQRLRAGVSLLRLRRGSARITTNLGAEPR